MGKRSVAAEETLTIGTRQRKAGSLEEVVVQAEDGVEVFRRLAAEDPVAHEHALCDGLARLGLALVAVGRTDAAREIHAQVAALAARIGEDAE